MAERITGHTELIGLMAYPIRHSSSPAMQNEAFAKLGYDYAYLAFEVGADEIEDAVKAIRTLKMRGSNVSMPNKTLVGKYLDELSPAAELCGAVNTIVNDNGHLTGHITDGIGFMSADITAAVKDLTSAKKKKPVYDQMDMAQMSLFDTVKDNDIIDEIKGLDMGNMTPIEAMNTLYNLQNKIKNRW